MAEVANGLQLKAAGDKGRGSWERRPEPVVQGSWLVSVYGRMTAACKAWLEHVPHTSIKWPRVGTRRPKRAERPRQLMGRAARLNLKKKGKNIPHPK